MWECLIGRVSFARKDASTSGSVSKPYVKATLQALPISPTPAKAAARAILEKVMGASEDAAVFLEILAVLASCASLRSSATSPTASILHLFSSLAAATLPWQPSKRGRRSNRGKRTNNADAWKASGEDLCSERARERTTSRASRSNCSDSFGKMRRLTGTLNKDISFRS